MSNTSAKRAPKRDPDPGLADDFEAAIRSGGRYLSLRNMQLEEVPNEVWSLENLEDLDLSGNNLRSIPQSLTELPHLKWVNLINNPIEDLPDLPGLMLDDTAYFLSRSRIDRSNIIGLVVSGELHGLDEDAWLSAIHSLRNLRELTIGPWAYKLLKQHPPAAKSELRLIDSLSDFPLLEALRISARFIQTKRTGALH